jgi:hypothetical protein
MRPDDYEDLVVWLVKVGLVFLAGAVVAMVVGAWLWC